MGLNSDRDVIDKLYYRMCSTDRCNYSLKRRMLEQLRALVSLVEDLGLVLSIYMTGSQPTVTLVQGALIPSSVLRGHKVYT